MKKFILILLKFILPVTLTAQKIVDPCFTSVTQLGFYYGSNDVRNICGCTDFSLATDMIEWDGEEWIGKLYYSEVDLPPPEGCSVRAVWCGSRYWTPGGEGIALRLDKGLETGKEYSFTFTYASDGVNSDGNFSPMVYTFGDGYPQFNGAFYIGQLPGADQWTTNTFTFTAQPKQAGHTWIILRAYESPGLIMSNCESILEPIEGALGEDKLICKNTSIDLEVPFNSNFRYTWNTGNTTNTITCSEAGNYAVEVTYGNCAVQSEVNIAVEDCEVRLEMPNLFTPNGDDKNPVFIPKEYNYIESGQMIIYNRWGDEVFAGDLFTGWDGNEAASGVYYYQVGYKARSGDVYSVKGTVTLIR